MDTTFAPTIQMHHATRTKATKLMATFAAEYPALTLSVTPGSVVDHEDYTHAVGAFVVTAEIEGEETTIAEGDKVPSLAAVLDACIEMDIDPSADEDDEPTHSGSVVPEIYRKLYREISTTRRSCGDWLAEQLAIDTLDVKGKLNVDDMVAILEANGVNLSAKWAQMRFTQTAGWQGRFRMSGRQVMEKLVAKSGVYIDHTGTEHAPDGKWMVAMRTKHAKWLEKEAKREAAIAAEAEADAAKQIAAE